MTHRQAARLLLVRLRGLDAPNTNSMPLRIYRDEAAS